MKNRKIPLYEQCGRIVAFAVMLLILQFLSAMPEATAQTNWKRLLNAPTYSVAVNPQNPNTIYVGGLARALYRSYDAGKNWDTLEVEFKGGNEIFSNVYVHPIDTNVVLIGGIRFGTIRRSTDNGETWEKVLETLSPITLNGESLIHDPHNSDILYLAHLDPAIIYKSYNRGKTWDSISTIPDIPYLCALTARQDSSNILFAGCAGGSIYKSTDSGKTWKNTVVTLPDLTDVNLTLETPKIVISRQNPQVAYAAMTAIFSVSQSNAGVYKTVDGGETWQHIAYADTNIWSVVTRLHDNKDEVVVGGFKSDVGLVGEGVIRRSLDGGETWQQFEKNIQWHPVSHPTFHKNVWMLKYAGTEGKTRLYMATERGFFEYDIDAPVAVSEMTRAIPSFSASLKDRFLTIDVGQIQTGHYAVRLVDMLGKTIIAQNLSLPFQQISLPPLTRGTYICQLMKNGTIIATRNVIHF